MAAIGGRRLSEGIDAWTNLVSVKIISHGTAVRIAPQEEGVSQLLNTVEITGKGGDVSVERVVALGEVKVDSPGGVVRLVGVTGGVISAIGGTVLLEESIAAMPKKDQSK